MNFDLEMTDNKIDTYKNLLLRRDSLKKEGDLVWLEYVRKFGNLIEELMKIKIECIALKKKIAYCQAKQNRNEIIVASEMEFEIETELADYYDELGKILFIKNSEGTTISDYEFLQIKRLYRKIAMMIHPDLHPELFDKFEIADLWNKAKNAYLSNDYEQLKETEFLIIQEIKNYSDTAENCEIENIDAKIENLRKEIEKIISSDPYKYKFLLENTKFMEEERNTIKNETEQYRQYIEELNKLFSKFTITEVLN
ncbi:MAG: hypothetical protein HDQ88_00995 [Clostridia bacterium]|nr:hypothetical protein [Clostridia bacterium]